MSYKINILIGMIATTIACASPSEEFRKALATGIGLSKNEELALYSSPLTPPPGGSSSILTDSHVSFLVDLVPHSPLNADGQPRVSLRGVYSSLLLACRAGKARWSKQRILEYEEAKKLLFRQADTADFIRGSDIPITPTVRATSYFQRITSVNPGDRISPSVLEENRILGEALAVYNSGGVGWPNIARKKAISQSETELITLYPGPSDFKSSPAWSELDLTPIAGHPCRRVRLLRVKIVYDFISEDFLTAKWWTASEMDLRSQGLGLPIATGSKADSENSGGSEVDIGFLHWIPRELILFTPLDEVQSVKGIAGFEALDATGMVAVGLVCETIGPLPRFNKNDYILEN